VTGGGAEIGGAVEPAPARDRGSAATGGGTPGRRRVRGGPELPLFAALWLAYAWFHSGGGWNQNARFAQVRAIVEQGRLSIDDYLVYAGARPAGADYELTRAPVVDGEVEIGGVRYALAWRGPDGRPAAVDGRDHPGARLAPLEDVASTGDVAFAGGRYFPNKAPGTALAAVPAYFVLYHLERLVGWSPDRWWVLTVNAWLTSALSVGLLAALAGLAVYRLALRLALRPAPVRSPRTRTAALAAAVTFGLGTLAWPYATMLHEHAPAAAGLAGSLLLLMAAREREEGGGITFAAGAPFAAGAAAGFAALASYAAAVPAAFLGVYALARLRRRRRAAAAFGLGLLVPLGAALAYHAACFGGPLTTGYALQNPEFRAGAGALLGVFEAPTLGRLAAILASPFRGLFVTSPVLLLGAVGLVVLCRRRETRPEGLLAAAVVLFFLAFNVSFNGWFGGWAIGPRYLAPALPFLALPLVVAFRRRPRTTAALAALSIVLQGLATAVDPQPPVGAASFASVPGRPTWRQDPLGDYALPLFLTGRAGPLLAARPEAAESLAYFRGPVSAHPTGIYEAWFGRLFPAGSRAARWNAFNAGELLFPGSRWSLAPPAVALVALLGLALARAREPVPTDPSLGNEHQGSV
jgi:hypothetical protein